MRNNRLRVFTVFIAIMIFTSGLINSSMSLEQVLAATNEKPDVELARAYSYQLFPEEWFANPAMKVSYESYSKAGLKIVEKLPGADVKAYKKYVHGALELKEIMPASDALLINYYIAVAAGDARLDMEIDLDTLCWETENSKVLEWNFSDRAWEYETFGLKEEDAYILWGNTNCEYRFGLTHCAKIFNLFRSTPYTGNSIFYTDFTENTDLLSKDLTGEMAIRYLTRTYESLLYSLSPKTGEALPTNNEYEKKIAARRKAILNSRTDIKKDTKYVQGSTYTGTAYYVSNAGNDNNDGLTEATPWATLDRVNTAELEYGDAVFLRRGDMWREYLEGREGVTYSAYGEGKKPVLCGSKENLADPDKWELYYKGNNGEQIWKLKNPKQTYASMFSADGEQIGYKKYLYFIDGEYYYVDYTDKTLEGNDIIYKKKLFNVKKNLADLEFFFSGDSRGFEAEELEKQGKSTGDLYFRCDAGNPGDVYSSIESGGICHSIASQAYSVYDNLSLIFSSGPIIHPYTDVIVQNCEASYNGGIVGGYYDDGEPSICGDGIAVAGADNIVRDCYVHDELDCGIPCEYAPTFEKPYENLLVSGCLIERATYGTGLTNFSEMYQGDEPAFNNVIFEDNYVAYTNEGWGTTIRKYDNINMMGAFATPLGRLKSKAENVRVTDNLFYSASGIGLVILSEKSGLTFDGNTYVQIPGGLVAAVYDKKIDLIWHIGYQNAKEEIKLVLGDKHATVVNYEISPRGTKLYDSVTKSVYQVTKAGSVKGTGGTVSFIKSLDDKAKSITIPKTVTIGAQTYKITAVGKNAFEGNNSVEKITIGANVKTIGAEAFINCKKLNTLVIKSSKIKSVGKNVFKGTGVTIKITVPAKKLTVYTKLFTGKGGKISVSK